VFVFTQQKDIKIVILKDGCLKSSPKLCPNLPFCVIDFLVEPDDGGDVVKAEVGEVGLGRVQRVPVVDPALRVRPAEGHELLGDEPVEIAVLKTGL
jgi:hypothetical protein